ncbi:hypothetical protein D3C76_1465460 [compost metagenome]
MGLPGEVSDHAFDADVIALSAQGVGVVRLAGDFGKQCGVGFVCVPVSVRYAN